MTSHSLRHLAKPLTPTSSRADFGLSELRFQGASEREREDEPQQERKSVIPKVYRAPEVRDLPPSKPANSTSADVYRSVMG